MFNDLTNRLNKLESALAGRECTCPPSKPAPLRPGLREVTRHAVHLGSLPCPDCGGQRSLVLVQVAIAEDGGIGLASN